jgi:hypothetical protein
MIAITALEGNPHRWPPRSAAASGVGSSRRSGFADGIGVLRRSRRAASSSATGPSRLALPIRRRRQSSDKGRGRISGLQ